MSTNLRLRELHRLNMMSEFHTYSDSPAQLEHQDGQILIDLRNPLDTKIRHHVRDLSSEYYKGEPDRDFTVTRAGFRFYSSTRVWERKLTIHDRISPKESLEDDESSRVVDLSSKVEDDTVVEFSGERSGIPFYCGPVRVKL